MNNAIVKSIILFSLILAVVSISFTFAILHHEDSDSRVKYALVTHTAQRVTQKDFAGRYQLVFFGFTSCRAICPMQMNKLTNVMYQLESMGHANRIIPMLISVDPERDTTEKMAEYLDFFHEKFVGLTGARVALKNAADSFKTLLSQAPANPEKGYQITHSSVVYLLDPFNRVVDFIPFSQDADQMTQHILKHL